MRWIVSSSLRFRLLVVVGAAAILVVGATQVHKAPVEVLPDFTPTTVEVQEEALGLSAEEVEQLITVPLEQDLLNGIAFLKDIRSESVPGLSRILMIFEPGTSVYTARQLVAERLAQAFANPQVVEAAAHAPAALVDRSRPAWSACRPRRSRRSRWGCSRGGRSRRRSWVFPESRTSRSGDSATGSCQVDVDPERLRDQRVDA